MTQMIQIADEQYASAAGHKMAREHGKTPNGNDLRGSWVLRDSAGEMIDFDWNMHDLLERQNFSVEFLPRTPTAAGARPT